MDRKQFLIAMAALAVGSIFKFDSLLAQSVGTDSPPPSTPKIGTSDREKHGLRGPVRSSVERTMTMEYDLDGRMISRRSGMMSGSEWVQTWKYDGDGRLIKITSGSTAETLYSYDAKGRLQSVTKRGDTNRIIDVAALTTTLGPRYSLKASFSRSPLREETTSIRACGAGCRTPLKVVVL